jgi:THO complex subunit 1
MLSLESHLRSLLKALPARPANPDNVDELVRNTLKEVPKSSAENRKSQWEYLLKNEIFTLAVRQLILSLRSVMTKYQATEGNALKAENTAYYDDLRDMLDLILAFTEHGQSLFHAMVPP